MKSKKAFTLIELLAVIVVLSIIALIVTPIISGIIDSSKKNSIGRSIEGYIDAVSNTYASSLLSSEKLTDGRYYINNDGNIVGKSKIFEVNVKGNKPTSGVIVLKNGKVIEGTTIELNDYIISYTQTNTNVKEKTNKKIYGLEYNKTNKTYKRLNDAEGLNACVGSNTETCINGFDSEEIYSEMLEIRDSYGNVFIKIPKIYIKKEVTDDYLRWYISKSKIDNDYYLPPCFFDEEKNEELDYILVGKYDASLSNDNTKLESKSNSSTLVNTAPNQFRIYALANNTDDITGYQLYDIYAHDVLQTLFYIEFANLDCQKIMEGYTYGISMYYAQHAVLNTASSTNTVELDKSEANNFIVGQYMNLSTKTSILDTATKRKIINVETADTTKIIFDGEPVNVTAGMYVSNYANDAGTTDNVLTSSGSPVSNGHGKYSMNYRGIENFYGNVKQTLDGVLLDNKSTGIGEIYYNKNAKNYSFTDKSKYSKIEKYTTPANSGSVYSLGYDISNPYIQLPNAIQSDGVYRDYYMYSSVEQLKIIVVGGAWFDAAASGITSFNPTFAANSVSPHVGARLMKTSK